MRRFVALIAILFITALAPAAFANPADDTRSTAVGHVAVDDDGPGAGGGYGK